MRGRTRKSRGATVLTVGSATLLVISVVASFAMFVLTRAAYIPSEGMTPTLPRSSTVWARPVAGTDVQRDDIIIFSNLDPSAAQAGARLVKRVVAVAGDRVEYRGGHLVVNGQESREDFLAPGTSTLPGPTSVDKTPSSVVPVGTVYVLGDNRTNSKDSRYFGPVPTSEVQGRVVAVASHSTAIAASLGAVAGVVVGAIGLIAGVIWLLASRKPDAVAPGPSGAPAA